MKIKIGIVDGRVVYASYIHRASGLPELVITGGISKFYRGSSLGPSNHQCAPSVEDVKYWQSLAGLPVDEGQARRSLAGIAAHRNRIGNALDALMDEPAKCHCGAITIRRWIDACGECETCCNKHMMEG